MEKAFDLKVLGDRLEAVGLPAAEDVIQAATKIIFGWTAESCAIKGGIYAVGVPLLPLLAEQLVKLEDKIDGVAGQ